jgi:hypothetical protein
MIHQLGYIGFIDPRFMRSLPTDGVVRGNKVVVGSAELQFVGEPMPDETVVKIFLHNRHFACQSLAEIEETFRLAKESRKEHERQQLEVYRLRQADALAFNASLRIPVAWRPEIKPVLSGLLEHSMCNGTRSNTVVHVLLEEQLSAGRLRREKGQPLCSRDMGSFGELIGWQEQSDHHVYRVTCKRCIEIAGRFPA